MLLSCRITKKKNQLGSILDVLERIRTNNKKGRKKVRRVRRFQERIETEEGGRNWRVGSIVSVGAGLTEKISVQE